MSSEHSTTPARPRGRYYEEFAVGDQLETAGRTIAETDLINFAGLTGDWNPLHVDEEYAAKSRFGQRIAHGTLGIAIAAGLVALLGIIDGTAIAARGIEEWKFLKPIYIGDTIRVKIEVTQAKLVPQLDGGLITFRLVVVNQHDDPVQQGSLSVGLLSRPSAPTES